MAKTITATGNKLDIKNPNSIHGMVQLALVLGLGFLLLIYAPRIEGVFNSLESYIEYPRNIRYSVPKLVYSALFLYFIFLCALKVLKNLYWGFQNILAFYVPPNIPKNLTDINATAGLLLGRNIPGFKMPDTFQKVARYFSERFTYLTAVPAQILVDSVNFIKGGIFWVIIIIAPYFLVDYIDEYFRLDYPFPIIFILAMASVAAVYVFSTLLLTAQAPDTSIVKEMSSTSFQGNPLNYYHYIERQFDGMRVRDFQNRSYINKAPVVNQVNKNMTNGFDGTIMVETQPLPLEQKFKKTAAFMDLGGATLQLLAYLMVFSLTTRHLSGRSLSIESSLVYLPGLVVALIGVIVALKNGQMFMQKAAALFRYYTFESELIYVELKGTYTAAQIGIGDGRGGEIYGNRVTMLADTNLTLLASRLITETNGLQPESDRNILSATCPPEFKDKMFEFHRNLTNYEDSSGSLPTVNLMDKGLQQTVEANTQIAAQKAAATTQARLAARKQFRNGWTDDGNRLNGSGSVGQIPEHEDDAIYCPGCSVRVEKESNFCSNCGRSVNNGNG